MKYASLFRKGEKWRERQRESDSDSNSDSDSEKRERRKFCVWKRGFVGYKAHQFFSSQPRVGPELAQDLCEKNERARERGCMRSG